MYYRSLCRVERIDLNISNSSQFKLLLLDDDGNTKQVFLTGLITENISSDNYNQLVDCSKSNEIFEVFYQSEDGKNLKIMGIR